MTRNKLAAKRSLNCGHQQRRGDSLASDIGNSYTCSAIIHIKVIVVITSNPESWETCAIDLKTIIFKSIDGEEVSLHFRGHLKFARNPLFFGHVADQFYVFNERSYLVTDDKQQALVFCCIGQLG